MASELIAPMVAGFIALVFAIYLIASVLRKEKGTPKMEEIAKAIREGASAYLNREYRTIAVFTIVIAVILGAAVNVPTAVTFLAGAMLSAIAGYVGMNISVRANVKTAQAAKKGIKEALEVAVQGGAVTGMFVVGLALLGVTIFYVQYQDPILIVGFGFGASLVSLFARVGGGIYTKSADVGADLVGKVEAGIPEDDPRNPGVIAD
ncbi:MAG: sodium/proton-translocating pyrophosphatase, partial [Candidatus Aenigmarchaeota archaeon]|nr:sodium/proton-translocating pyrophosphatase [Candidatus Aenigmarchaeota archaeon]